VTRTVHVVFDLDGTLIDSLRDLGASASELVTTLGGRPLGPEEVAVMIGEGASVLVRRALAAADVDPETPGALSRFLAIYDRRLLETTVPYEGVEEMLLLASRRARLSVLTNKPLSSSRRILEGDGPHGRKPDPAGLHHLTSGAATVVLVGDSPIDWTTARTAGCTFVWARYGFGAGRFDAPPTTPYAIDRPADLTAVLDRIAAMATGA
jgi:phosphoglycolate phosphatase